jgi:hypothetical protein
MSKDEFYQKKIEKDNLKIEKLKRELEEENAKKAEHEKKAKYDKEVSDLENAIEARKAMISTIMGFYLPNAPTRGEGSLDHIEHSTNLNPEAQAMGLIMDLIVFAFEFLFNIPYLRDKLQYNEALKKEIEAKSNGEPLDLVYRGQPLYKIDRKTGKPDLNELLTHPKEFDIIGHGYVIEPDVKKGLLKAFDKHQERMRPGRLTPEQRMRLHGLLDAADQAAPKKNIARDLRIMKGGKK